ncbi:hypothetical protein K9M42_02180 [Patescibacteria group bacterium]|nr:hypothetical protein [Patescibacteria group bacterium]
MKNNYNGLVNLLIKAKKCNSRIKAKKYLLQFLNDLKNIIENVSDYKELTSIAILDKKCLFSSHKNEINKNFVTQTISTNGLFAQILEYIRIDNFNETSETLIDFIYDLETELSLNRDIEKSKKILLNFINNIIDAVINTEVYE